MRAKLADGVPLKALKDVLTKDPSLSVDVQRKAVLHRPQKAMSKLINNIGLWIAIVMGLAALFAALNTLESAVASRVREIATLGHGFRRRPGCSGIRRSHDFRAIGGLLGGLVAFFFPNGITSSTLNFAVFQPIPTRSTFAALLLLASLMGSVGLLAGILPGIGRPECPSPEGLAYCDETIPLLIGALALAGASSFWLRQSSWPRPWSGRTWKAASSTPTTPNDARALNAVVPVKPKPGAEGRRSSGPQPAEYTRSPGAHSTTVGASPHRHARRRR